MTTNHEHDGEDEIQAARRTAHALRQTEGAEQAEVAAELAASPQARQEVEAVEALAVRLKEAACEAPRPEPSPALREAVERRLAELEPTAGRAAVQRKARPWWRSRMAALALTAACLAALAPIIWSIDSLRPRKERNVARGIMPQNNMLSEPEGASPEKFERFDINDPEDVRSAEMDVDPTLRKPGEAVHEAELNDVEHRGGGAAKAVKDLGASGGGAMAFGHGPRVSGTPGVGTGGADYSGFGAGKRDIQVPAGTTIDPGALNRIIANGATTSPQPNVPTTVSGSGITGAMADGGARMGLAGGLHDALAQADGVTLTESGTGVLTLNGANTCLGSMTLSAGTAQMGIGAAFGGNGAPGHDGRAGEASQLLQSLRSWGGVSDTNVDVTVDSGGTATNSGPMSSRQVSGFQGHDTTTTDESRSEVQTYAKILAGNIDTASASMTWRTRSQNAKGNDSELPKPETKKPLETWKPAHVVPNSSRLMVGEREELPLKGMQVDVRVDGFRARVLIDLYYFNDRPQQLEGNFQLRLPDEASPYFFAFGRTVYQAPQITAGDSMFFKPQQVSLGDTTPEKILALRGNSWEQPKVARMVPKEKAALAYRDTVRRRVDPALVEWSGAGVFQCRVFPLAPQSLHRVTIGYDVDLLRVGEDLELRLDLPGQTPATIVDLNIAASDARQVSLDAPATASPDGQRLSYRLIDPKDRPLAVRLRKPGTLMLTGNDEATGNYFATRVGLTLPETPAANRAKQAIFLVDTSLSAGPQFPLWTKLLRATLENNRDSIKEFAVVFFNVETFWWQEKFVANTPENVDALMNYADGLAVEGATDLGRVLKEAASPAWCKVGFSPPPDLFLLSDGAATWGEDRWALLAAALNANVAPEKAVGWDQRASSERRPTMIDNDTEATVGRRSLRDLVPPYDRTPGPTLFAYRTGLAGGDPRLLAYLAEQTGGAVFSLVGEAEIAAASVAHRNRPWRLTGIEMAGGHDLLVAGRPQYVFPGQQLLVVGSLEHHSLAPIGPIGPMGPISPIIFTLQQGKATQTISVKPDQVLTSELAARTFGQVATSQLEDVCGAAAVEPVATAYARHFRVTGRTCSLLMLETEQDYARFNIKPEEDSFVVKGRPAGPIVAKTVAEATAAMSDPKAHFLAWYRRVRAASEVHFDLPASLDIALEGLPAETFAVTAPPLQCKLRLRKDLPENLRQPWQSGLPDYETLAAEAQRRLTAYGADDALRGLSSLVEDRPGDAALARDLAFSAIEWQRPGEAYHLLRRAGAARTFEPITFHAMAHCLELMGQADLAIVYYELACGGQWDVRFGDIHNIAQLDYLRFLRRVADGREKAALADYAKARLATLAAMQLRDTADVAALIFWNTDGTDVDLHVIEPSGEECFYQHTQTASGGHISRDVTTGYGPELYLLPSAPAGIYRVSAHYFAADANRASTRTKVFALIYEGWGTKDERVTVKALALTGRSESHDLATVKR